MVGKEIERWHTTHSFSIPTIYNNPNILGYAEISGQLKIDTIVQNVHLPHLDKYF